VIQVFVFYLFATLVIASGAMTVASRNPVHSVLWLILAFFNAAGLFLLMLDVDFAALRAGFASYLFPGILLAIALLAEIVAALLARGAGVIALSARAAPIDAGRSNIEALGQLLYTRYLFIFEAAGLVLLVAMVGAIVLTRRRRSDVRPQNVSAQVRRRPEDAVVNMRPGVGQGVEL